MSWTALEKRKGFDQEPKGVGHYRYNYPERKTNLSVRQTLLLPVSIGRANINLSALGVMIERTARDIEARATSRVVEGAHKNPTALHICTCGRINHVRKSLIVILCVLRECQTELLQIAGATGAARILPCLPENWKQDRREDRYEGNHD